MRKRTCVDAPGRVCNKEDLDAERRKDAHAEGDVKGRVALRRGVGGKREEGWTCMKRR